MKTVTLPKSPMEVALEEAFRRLPIRRGDPSRGIPYEVLIPDISRELILMRSGSQPPKGASASVAQKKLASLSRATGRTIKELDQLPSNAVDALNLRPAALRDLTTRLRILQATAASAKPQESSSLGQPPKVQARKIAQTVALHYERLTGLSPTVSTKGGKAYGPFVTFLSTVFDILEIDASAESQARKVSYSI